MGSGAEGVGVRVFPVLRRPRRGHDRVSRPRGFFPEQWDDLEKKNGEDDRTERVDGSSGTSWVTGRGLGPCVPGDPECQIKMVRFPCPQSGGDPS